MKVNELTKDTIYVEIERMAKAFRVSINSMPDKARASIGKDISITLRKAKFFALLSTKFNYYSSLYKELVRVKVLVDECLEDSLLLMKGKDNIIIPREKLMNICNLVESLVEPSSMKD